MAKVSNLRGLKCRDAHYADLEELEVIEAQGAFEPIRLQQLQRWYERSECPRDVRGKRMWTTLRVVSDQLGLIFGYAALIGENDLATARVTIHPKFRGEGLGRRVLSEALADAQRRHQLRLAEAIISEQQESSLAFATNFGFRVREYQPVARDWFGPHHDGYVLVLPITPAYEHLP